MHLEDGLFNAQNSNWMINLHATYQRVLRWVVLAELMWWVLVLLIFAFDPFSSLGLSLLHPKMLWLWCLILPIVGASIAQWQWKSRLFDNYSSHGVTRMLTVNTQPIRAFLHYFLLRTFVFMVVLAMAQPVGGSRKVTGSKRVLDLVVCLDISNSMNTKDMGGGSASRLTAAKHAIQELLNQLKGERVSIVIFANEAYVQLPLTMDYGAAKLYLPDIETNMISDQGTNIGSALQAAQTQFKDGESGKAVLIITDGEDHEKLYQEEINKLDQKQVELALLGLGSSKGGLIPNDPFDESQGFKREGGKAVVSRLDQQALNKMAAKSGATLVVSDNEFPNIIDIATNFKNSKNKVVKKLEFKVEQNFYFVPSLLAIFSLIIYLFLPQMIKEN